MAADEKPKNWGTIFMGTQREVNLEQLSKVAPHRGVFWRRDEEETYLDRVQQRAKEQAQTILAQTGKESDALLGAARGDIARMRGEAEQQIADLLAEQRQLRDEAARLHEEAARLKDESARLNAEARLRHAGAKEKGHAEGYAAGIAHAQGDLEHFRAVMGEATGAVISAVHAQCDHILAVWKEDLCALLTACVEKGTGFVLDADRKALLERLFLDAVKLFEARSVVVMRVRSEDEALVAEMLAAARERIPGLDAWRVQGDPGLAPGDLVLEAAHSRVESRVEERRSVVDEALRYVLLPASPEEESGREELAQVAAGALTRMFELIPKPPRIPDAPQDAGTTGEDAAQTMAGPRAEAPAQAPAPAPAPAPVSVPAPEAGARAAASAQAPVQVSAPEATAFAGPDVPDDPGEPDELDAVLAGGGFLPAEER